MRTIVLDITDSYISYHLELDRRINFIKGDSATGKTGLVNILNDSINDTSIKVSCNYSYLPVTNLSWKDDIKYRKNTLLIFDDIEVVSSKLFSNLVHDYAIENDLCFLIMSREDQDDISHVGRLSFSTNNIFKFVVKDNIHVLERYYNLPNHSGGYDLCITEDSNAGFQFFNSLISECRVVSATSGKSSIIEDIQRYTSSGKYKDILVILDTAAYGCHMEELYSRFSRSEYNVAFISSYECFEELLVRSNLVNKLNLVKNQLSDLPKYANDYISWEIYFEELLNKATKGKFYHQIHKGNLNRCYVKDCSLCNNYIISKCDGVLNGEKFRALLEGTKYEFLLNL